MPQLFAWKSGPKSQRRKSKNDIYIKLLGVGVIESSQSKGVKRKIWQRKLRIGVNFQGELKQRGVKQGLDLCTVIKIDTSVLSQLFCSSCINLMKSLKQTCQLWWLVTFVLVLVAVELIRLTLILRRSRTGTVWFYTSTSNKRAAPPKLYTKLLARDLKFMYSRLTLVRISINL